MSHYCNITVQWQKYRYFIVAISMGVLFKLNRIYFLSMILYIIEEQIYWHLIF